MISANVVTIDNFDLAPIEGEAEQLILVVNGTKYELDLSRSNFTRFTETLLPWLRHTEGVAVPPHLWREVVAVAAPGKVDENRLIRSWWEANYKRLGLPTPGPSGRGRIPRSVVRTYYEELRYGRNGGAGSGANESTGG